jgi:hypothetical protein
MDGYEAEVSPPSATCHCGNTKLAVYRTTGEPRLTVCEVCDALPIAMMRTIAQSQHPGSK